MFEQEARRLQHLGQHPQIPALLAYFEQDKRLYLVQEYIEGQNLFDELQQQGTFSEQKIRELLVDLLEILKVVHQQHVIHRDIKPENILRRTLTPNPSPIKGEGSNRMGQLVLIDFGASKQATATAMAKPGTTIGSFGYVPIEQMQGGEAYPSSDLYSLGATCFHLLSGIHPWELWKQQAYGWVQNWRQHLQQPITQDLGAILDKLLQENHQQRYQSAEEVLRSLNSQPPPPPPVPPTVVPHRQPPPSPPKASAKQNAKLKTPLLVGGTILLLGLGGYKVLYVSNPLPPPTAYKNLALDKTLSGHSDNVICVAFSPDGQTIASGSVDKTIKIWRVPK